MLTYADVSQNDAIDQRLDPEMELDRLNRKSVDLR
jgi:hypothetical protein